MKEKDSVQAHPHMNGHFMTAVRAVRETVESILASHPDLPLNFRIGPAPEGSKHEGIGVWVQTYAEKGVTEALKNSIPDCEITVQDFTDVISAAGESLGPRFRFEEQRADESRVFSITRVPAI